MLNNIQNEELILNNTITKQSRVLGAEKKQAAQNPYRKNAEFADVIDISEQAKKLYEKEKEIEKYKSIVMEMLKSPEEEEDLASMAELLGSGIKSGDYISNDELAEDIIGKELSINGSRLLRMLFSEAEENLEIIGTNKTDT